jgi:hypothetical protein
MRVGKVYVLYSYVVDLDNEEMVRCAKEWLREDLEYASSDDLAISIKEMPNLSEKDIHSGLKEICEGNNDSTGTY